MTEFAVTSSFQPPATPKRSGWMVVIIWLGTWSLCGFGLGFPSVVLSIVSVFITPLKKILLAPLYLHTDWMTVMQREMASQKPASEAEMKAMMMGMKVTQYFCEYYLLVLTFGVLGACLLFWLALKNKHHWDKDCRRASLVCALIYLLMYGGSLSCFYTAVAISPKGPATIQTEFHQVTNPAE